MLASAEDDGRDREVHLVDEPRLEILTNGRRAAADLDVVLSRGSPRFGERAMDVVDEDELCAAFHLHGRAAVVRENEDGHVVGWVLAPPTLPAFVRPGPAHRSEHVAPHDVRADVAAGACGEIVVYTRGAALLLTMHALPASRGNQPRVQVLSTDAEWVLDALIRAGAVAVDRDGETVDSQFGHRSSLRVDASL